MRALLVLLIVAATALFVVGVALAMLAFALLDAREVVHQADIDETGLAVLAAVIAVLHLASAAVAGRMARVSSFPQS